MHSFAAMIEKCPDTGMLVGYVPGLPGAYSQGAPHEELAANLPEVIEMLMVDRELVFESLFNGCS